MADPTRADPRARFVGTVAVRLAAVALSAVAAVVLARELGPAGRGAYAMVVAVALTSVSLGHLSLEQANVFLWQRRVPRETLASNAVLVAAGAGALAAAVAGAVVAASGLVPGVGRWAVAAALVAVPFNLGALYLNNLTVLDDRIGRVNAGALGAAMLLALGFTALAAGSDLTVDRALLLWALAAAFPLAVLVPGLGVRLRRLDLGVARDSLARGLRYHLGMAALFLLWRVDVFLLEGLSTTAQVGLYAVAVAVGELLQVGTNAFAELVLPSQVGDDDHDAARFTARAFRVNVVVAVGGGIALAATAPVAVPLVFGESFRDAAVPLMTLLPGVVALGLLRPVTAYLVRLDRPFVVSGLVWSALALNVVLNLVLIPPFEATGAAAASSIAYGLLSASYLVWFTRASVVEPAELWPSPREALTLALRWPREAV